MRVSKPFDQRVRKIQRQHRALSQGYSLKIDRNNLIVPRPRYAVIQFPWKAICIAAIIGLGFKSYVMTTYSADAYAAKIAQLAAGPLLEQAGAFVMQPDPVASAIAGAMRAAFN